MFSLFIKSRFLKKSANFIGFLAGNPLENSIGDKWDFVPWTDRRFHMRKSRFTDSQIMAILKQAESGVPVPELCMSSAIFYKWRSKYGGISLCQPSCPVGDIA